MHKMCTRRVVGVCVFWSAYIKEKTTHILCVLYILVMWLFIYEQRILTGFEPTISYYLFTLHSTGHYHIALIGTCIIISLQWYLLLIYISSIRIADIAQTRIQCLYLNEIGTTELD